jgi:hypothetical protein
MWECLGIPAWTQTNPIRRAYSQVGGHFLKTLSPLGANRGQDRSLSVSSLNAVPVERCKLLSTGELGYIPAVLCTEDIQDEPVR